MYVNVSAYVSYECALYRGLRDSVRILAFSYAFRYTFVGFKYSSLCESWLVGMRQVRTKAFIIVDNNSTNRVYRRKITNM